MYIFPGLVFGIFAIIFTVTLFTKPNGKIIEPNLSLFVIATLLLYLLSIISFGIDSICNKLNDIKNKKE